MHQVSARRRRRRLHSLCDAADVSKRSQLGLIIDSVAALLGEDMNLADLLGAQTHAGWYARAQANSEAALRRRNTGYFFDPTKSLEDESGRTVLGS